MPIIKEVPDFPSNRDGTTSPGSENATPGGATPQPDPQGVEVTAEDRQIVHKIIGAFQDYDGTKDLVPELDRLVSNHRAAAAAKALNYQEKAVLKVVGELPEPFMHSSLGEKVAEAIRLKDEAMRGWPVECLLLLKSLMLVWGDKFAPGTKEQFGAIEKAALSQTAVTTDRVAEATKPLVELLIRIAHTYPDIAQLLQGWHADGTCWSEWDQKVYDQVLKDQLAVEDALRAHEERVKGGKA